jgi:hypothetical protein
VLRLQFFTFKTQCIELFWAGGGQRWLPPAWQCYKKTGRIEGRHIGSSPTVLAERSDGKFRYGTWLRVIAFHSCDYWFDSKSFLKDSIIN